MVGQLVTGEVSPELLSGPIGIVSATAETARFGFRELILLCWIYLCQPRLCQSATDSNR